MTGRGALRQVHLAAFVEGVNHTTIWSHPDAGSQIEIETFRHIARAAERGLFDFMFLGQGLRLREYRSEFLELDIAGRPESFTLLSAIAAVTTHLGLAATINTTFTEPEQIARDFASLDAFAPGRTAWNIVTSNDAFTGANFRKGGYLDYADRYRRAGDVVTAAERLWSAWSEAGPTRAIQQGGFADIDTLPALPGPAEGRPIYIQAGDSADGRDFAVEIADIVFSRHTTGPAATEFARDLSERLARSGRTRDSIRILPIAHIVLGPTDSEARDRARKVSLAQVSPQRALVFAGQVWGTDLSGYDPHGPLPDFDPEVRPAAGLKGNVASKTDPRETVATWRAIAERDGHTLHSLMAAIYGKAEFVGTPASVAAQLSDAVQSGDVDGYALSPYLNPTGIDELADHLVPALQALGAYPTRYASTSARQRLGLAVPARTHFENTTPQETTNAQH